MVDLQSLANELNGKPVAVFGLGVSGIPTVKALCAAGIDVYAWDDKEENQEKAKELGALIEDLSSKDLQGFAFLVLAPGVPYTFNPHPVVQNAQKHNVEIIGDLELLHRSGHGLKTIGITGTNGKSTTTALMTHTLNECGLKAVMGGNIGKAVFDLDLSDENTVLILEISSYQMDLCPTFRPDISVLLNVTPDHLDRHGSMDAYVAAKEKIFEGEGVAVIDVDDDFSQEIFNKVFFAGKRKVTPISVKTKITEGYYVSEGVLYQNHGGNEIEVGKLDDSKALKGVHNHQNALCVYVVSQELGLNHDDIFKAFEGFPGLPHRQYLVTQTDKVSYINDSKATNAEAAAKALSSFDDVFWIIGGRAKEGGLNGLEIFRDKIQKTYVIGEAQKEFSEWLIAHGFSHKLCNTLDKAVAHAHQDAQDFEGKAVVLLSPACASWDQFSSFEKRGDAFEQEVLNLVKSEAA